LAEVRIQEGESLENALRRFKRKVQQEDIIKEVKRHSFYLKPGEANVSKGAFGTETKPQESSQGTRLASPWAAALQAAGPLFFPNRFAFGSAGLLPRSSSGVSVQTL